MDSLKTVPDLVLGMVRRYCHHLPDRLRRSIPLIGIVDRPGEEAAREELDEALPF
jgi:hypothetical protein